MKLSNAKYNRLQINSKGNFLRKKVIKEQKLRSVQSLIFYDSLFYDNPSMKDLTLKITWRISSGRFQKTRQRKQTNFLFDDIPLDKYYARKFEHIKLQPCNRHRQTLVIWNRKQEKHNRSNWLLQFSAVFKRPVYNCLCTIILFLSLVHS